MLPRIDRYLIREVLLTLLGTVLVLVAIMLSNRLAGFLSKAAAGDLAREAILMLLGLQALRLLVVLVPVSFLLAVLLTLGRWYRDNEMTALAACGFGPGAVYRALFSLAVPLALVLAVVSLYLLPMAMAMEFDLRVRARQEAELSVFSAGAFREVGDSGHVVYVESVDRDDGEIRRVFIQSRQGDATAITTAVRGRQEVDPESGARYLVLDDGQRFEDATGGGGGYRSVRFERLALRVDKPPAARSALRQEARPAADLLASGDPGALAELHGRVGGPLSVLVIAFVAPLLAHANPREGRYGRVIAGVLLYVIYLNLLGVGQAWVEHGSVPASVGLWWVHGLVLAVGAVLWLRHYGRPRIGDRARASR